MRYFRVRNTIKGGLASITVAVKPNGDCVSIGVAFQSPKDQLHKALSRTIASGRAEKRPALVVAKILVENDRGRISAPRVMSMIKECLSEKLKRSLEVEDPHEREQIYHLPRWIGEFLDIWESNIVEPQLPHMPR